MGAPERTSTATTPGLDAGTGCERALCRLLLQRTGLQLKPHQLPNLRDTVLQACEQLGYTCAEEYLKALEKGPRDSPEMESLVAGVTIGETYFFRESAQLNFVRDTWLPGVLREKERRGSKSLRIWSAGCSSGEEVYTLAILLREAIPCIEDWTLHLLGTDINTDSLSRAVDGCYREWSLRATSEDARRRYFSETKTGFEVHTDLRGMVKFNYLNLIDDTYPSIFSETNALDLILCRNVFIYFDQQSIDQVLRKFGNSLVAGGVLLLGVCDPLKVDVPHLKKQIHGEVACFLAEKESSAGSAYERKIFDVPSPFASGATETNRRTPAGHPEQESPATRFPDATASSTRDEAVHSEITDLLRREMWTEVVDAVNARSDVEPETAILLRHKTTALANLGELTTACQVCERCVALDPMDRQSHFLQGLVLLELHRVQEAEAAWRRALYLDSSFLEAQYQLGLLRLRTGKRRAGLRNLTNALKLAERAPSEHEVHGAPGMTYGRLVNVLNHDIEMYSS